MSARSKVVQIHAAKTKIIQGYVEIRCFLFLLRWVEFSGSRPAIQRLTAIACIWSCAWHAMGSRNRISSMHHMSCKIHAASNHFRWRRASSSSSPGAPSSSFKTKGWRGWSQTLFVASGGAPESWVWRLLAWYVPCWRSGHTLTAGDNMELIKTTDKATRMIEFSIEPFENCYSVKGHLDLYTFSHVTKSPSSSLNYLEVSTNFDHLVTVGQSVLINRLG
jgi:hypothetical protein